MSKNGKIYNKLMIILNESTTPQSRNPLTHRSADKYSTATAIMIVIVNMDTTYGVVWILEIIVDSQ